VQIVKNINTGKKKTNDNRIRNALFADAELTKLLEQVSIPHVLIIR